MNLSINHIVKTAKIVTTTVTEITIKDIITGNSTNIETTTIFTNINGLYAMETNTKTSVSFKNPHTSEINTTIKEMHEKDGIITQIT